MADLHCCSSYMLIELEFCPVAAISLCFGAILINTGVYVFSSYNAIETGKLISALSLSMLTSPHPCSGKLRNDWLAENERQ